MNGGLPTGSSASSGVPVSSGAGNPVNSGAGLPMAATSSNQVPPLNGGSTPPPGNHPPAPPNGDPTQNLNPQGVNPSTVNGVNSNDQVLLLARRMDSLADTMNGLMLALTPLLGQVPNITGWPPGSNQANNTPPAPSSGANAGSLGISQSASGSGGVISNSGTSQAGNANSGANTGSLGISQTAPGLSAMAPIPVAQLGNQGASHPPSVAGPTGAFPASATAPQGPPQLRPASNSFVQSRISSNRWPLFNAQLPYANTQPNHPMVRPSIFSQPLSSSIHPTWASHSTPLGTNGQQIPSQGQPINQQAQALQPHLQLGGQPQQGYMPQGNQCSQAPQQVLQSSLAAPATAGQGPLPQPAPFTVPFSSNQDNVAQPVLRTPQHFQVRTSSQNAAVTNGPRGDAYDTDDDVFLPANPLSDHSSRSQGRGRARTRRTGHDQIQPRDLIQTRDPDSGPDDPNDEYAENRLCLERDPKRIEIQEFNSSGKVDFDIWVGKYEVAINQGRNPHSKRRHHKYCLKHLPMYLDSNAYVIWKRSAHRKTNWEELKKELRREFEDPIIRSEWKGNLRAYVWDESKETLHTYCSKVKRYVDTFEDELVDGSKAKLDQYYLRFKSGLPDDYQDQVRMAMPTHKQSVEKAYDVCLRFQATKKSKTKSEHAAAVTFEDPSMPARVTQNESNIIRLKNRLAKLELTPQSQGTDSKQQRSNNNYRGNSPGRY